MENDTPTTAPRGRGRPRKYPPVQEPTVMTAPEPIAVDRPPIRADVRDDVRPSVSKIEDPRAAAERRAKEILGHLGSMDEGTDEYYIDPAVIPPGWSYEWKTFSVYGKENPSYQVGLARTGWAVVPASRHPEMMPKGWGGEMIERKGQILMERPLVITDMQKQNEKKKARDQVKVKEQQLSNAPQGQLPRAGDADGDARTRPNIKKAYEPMPIPADQ